MADINVLKDDISCNITYDSPNPEYKSYMIVHGWLETRNTYAINTNVCFSIYQNIQSIIFEDKERMKENRFFKK